jgi:hypothetical protein
MFWILDTARAWGEVGGGSGIEVEFESVSSDGGADGSIVELGALSVLACGSGSLDSDLM